MDVAPFEQLLKQTMGLDAASSGSAVVRRAVQERLATCQLPDEQAYWKRLGSSAPELQELIEAVVAWSCRRPGSSATRRRPSRRWHAFFAKTGGPRRRRRGCAC